jgi:hypothetical protein
MATMVAATAACAHLRREDGCADCSGVEEEEVMRCERKTAMGIGEVLPIFDGPAEILTPGRLAHACNKAANPAHLSPPPVQFIPTKS